MRIAYSPYQLQQKGVLLRFQFSPGSFGFSDCHPWEARGDLPLSKQLSLLKEGMFTPLTERSFFFAQQDAEARQNRVHCFANLEIPESHFLICALTSDSVRQIPQLLAQGFTACKIKISKQDQHMLPLLKEVVQDADPRDFRIRLDANECFSWEEWVDFSKGLYPLAPWIEFIEDPFVYEPKRWHQMQVQGPFRFACDRCSQQAIGNPDSAPFLILKPAVQSPTPFSLATSSQTILITSYLDHPLGQVQAAWVAASWARENPKSLGLCGLLTHTCYEENAFSRQLRLQQNRLIPPQGTGFGFDLLLQEQKWVSL